MQEWKNSYVTISVGADMAAAINASVDRENERMEHILSHEEGCEDPRFHRIYAPAAGSIAFQPIEVCE
jgi:hypothetical protein